MSVELMMPYGVVWQSAIPFAFSEDSMPWYKYEYVDYHQLATLFYDNHISWFSYRENKFYLFSKKCSVIMFYTVPYRVAIPYDNPVGRIHVKVKKEDLMGFIANHRYYRPRVSVPINSRRRVVFKEEKLDWRIYGF